MFEDTYTRKQERMIDNSLESSLPQASRDAQRSASGRSLSQRAESQPYNSCTTSVAQVAQGTLKPRFAIEVPPKATIDGAMAAFK